MAPRWRHAVSLGALALALGVAGCGVEVPRPPTPAPTSSTPTATPTPPTVGVAFRDARTAALSAESGRLEGTLGAGARARTVELEGSASGTNQRETVSVGEGTAEVLTIGGEYWLSGDVTFWTERLGSAARAKERGDRYEAVAADEAADVADDTLRGLLTALFADPALAPLEGNGDAVVDDVVDGRDAWVLGEEGARLWVAADGSAELLRAEADGTLALTFSDWGRVTPFTEPAPGDVVG